ncbi:MAG: FGGY-family carbohydrate kinase [Gemmataceae bacterium]|nr:FGGY-family carbohydrate kinase [Gemmataceae bacterium]
MNILALDVGTSSVKAAVLDVETADPVGGVARVSYALDSPTPDAAEVPADRLWQTVATAARTAMVRAGVAGTPQDVRGIGLSVLTPALVLLDEADRPLLPIWTHLDRRARPAARRVWNAVGEEFLRSTGNRPLPGGMTALCYRQMLTDEPYLSHDVRAFLHANGWLAFHMTGEKAFDRGNACFTGLYGTLTDQQWSPRWCDYFEVDRAWLPPVVCGSTTMGTLRSGPAGEMGVPGGIPVKLGAADTSSAMLAAGMQPGDLMHVVGTTQVLAAFADNPVPAPQRLTRYLGVGEQFIHVTHNPVGGVALDWFRQLCFREQSEQEFYDNSIAQALKRKTRVSLDPPFLGGDRLEIDARRAAFRDLELTTDRLDLLAALLDAMVRRHREALAALGQGTSFRRIVLTGGGAEVVQKLIPEYQSANIVRLEEGSLRGVAKLFLH